MQLYYRRYHAERKPFTCQVCGRAFSSSEDLSRHGKCHLGNSMFTCDVCFQVFANSATLGNRFYCKLNFLADFRLLNIKYIFDNR